jgi:hypothetical protein
MTKDIVKEGFQAAEKDLKEKQVAEVKRIVTKTLEKLEQVQKDARKLKEEERVLKMDIDDLKEGRLDRISERQEKDPEAKKISVVLIIKEKEVIREVSPWYFPYQVVWQVPYVPHIPVRYAEPVFGGAAINSISGYVGGGSSANCLLSTGDSFKATCANSMITCAVARDATVGAYEVDGHVVHLR